MPPNTMPEMLEFYDTSNGVIDRLKALHRQRYSVANELYGILSASDATDATATVCLGGTFGRSSWLLRVTERRGVCQRNPYRPRKSIDKHAPSRANGWWLEAPRSPAIGRRAARTGAH
ncbi:hypothetical protein G5I_00784 [Acromyrmex echinatior]|uniref:Uncharacterized protein n=1 Tax=Acromyrmex echinatior TaxID=103372 RepID=F4W5T5_ACREC|nr:hypothetical protein G5I_00784 [Acromyrmex echinatior]